MKKNFTDSDLKKALNGYADKAADILNDKDKWKKLESKMQEFLDKAKTVPVIGEVIDDVATMVSLAAAYVKGEYTDVQPKTIIWIICCLLYLLNPIDIIPDAIPLIGFLDDVAVVALVLKYGVKEDLDRFRTREQREEQDDEASNGSAKSQASEKAQESATIDATAAEPLDSSYDGYNGEVE